MIFWTVAILLLQILITQCEKINEPTLKPFNPFSDRADGEIFKHELLWDDHPNRHQIAKIWFHRTHEQRMKIDAFYNTIACSNSSFGDRCPLKDALKDISVGSLDDLYSDSFWSPQSLLGRTINEAITGKWKEVGAIEEIVCGNEKEIKDKIADYYKATYHDTVENHLAKFKKEDAEYQHVMQKYCWKGLCQEKKIKPEDAEKEASALRKIDPVKSNINAIISYTGLGKIQRVF